MGFSPGSVSLGSHQTTVLSSLVVRTCSVLPGGAHTRKTSRGFSILVGQRACRCSSCQSYSFFLICSCGSFSLSPLRSKSRLLPQQGGGSTSVQACPWVDLSSLPLMLSPASPHTFFLLHTPTPTSLCTAPFSPAPLEIKILVRCMFQFPIVHPSAFLFNIRI